MNDCLNFDVKAPESCPICGCSDLIIQIRPNASLARVFCCRCSNEWDLRHITGKPKRYTVDQKWATVVFRNDLGRCHICGSTENLQAHHIIPYSVASTFEKINPRNGILLCEECHKKVHQKEKKENV